MAEKKYSYIKYPYSKNGWISLALSSVSLILTAAVAVLSIMRNGNTTEFLASCGLTAVIMSIMGMWFSFLALTEREKNYLFAFVGGGVSFALTVIWVAIIVSGSR